MLYDKFENLHVKQSILESTSKIGDMLRRHVYNKRLADILWECKGGLRKAKNGLVALLYHQYYQCWEKW